LVRSHPDGGIKGEIMRTPLITGLILIDVRTGYVIDTVYGIFW